MTGSPRKPGPKTVEILRRENGIIGNSMKIKLYPLTVKDAEGAVLKDVDDNEYLDFLAGWTVSGLGYNHPRVVSYVKENLNIMGVPSISYANELTVKFAEELCKVMSGSFRKKVWFGNSGTEACDYVCKLIPYLTKKMKAISFFGSYHGSATGGVMMAGHKVLAKYPIPTNVVKTPYAYCYRCALHLEYPECGIYCADYIDEVLFNNVLQPQDVAFIIAEPLQSDGGEVVPPDGFFPKVKRICERNGILFVTDEVKASLARTGKMLGIQHYNVTPDAVILGKSIGSGMPISALVTRAELLDSDAVLTTLSGNPLSCAAGLATLETINRERLVERAAKLGSYLKRRFEEMKEKHPLIGDVRGKGLFLGVELVRNLKTKDPAHMEAVKVCYKAWELGLVIGYMGNFENVLEITPPLTIREDQLNSGMEMLERAIDGVEKGEVSDEKVAEYTGW